MTTRETSGERSGRYNPERAEAASTPLFCGVVGRGPCPWPAPSELCRVGCCACSAERLRSVWSGAAAAQSLL